MKKYLLLFSLFVVTLSACNKDQITAQASVDDAKIQAYIKANNITGLTKDPSGVYYSVLKAGTGAYPVSSFTAVSSTDPTTGSTIRYSYIGQYLNGQTFQSSEGSTLTLNKSAGVIDGFLYGMPHINAGGRIFLIIPSALAYGTGGNGSIPANACLIFTVDLLSFY